MKYRVKRHAVTQPLDTSYRLIPLTQNQNALVDTEDFESLSRFNWIARWSKCTKSFYAARGHPTIYMHRVVKNCKVGEKIDHWNHDTLDNRKHNLRNCGVAGNQQNSRKYSSARTSHYKGVSFKTERKKWVAQIQAMKKKKHLGYFASEQEAANAYDVAARELHGIFARTNADEADA